MPTPAPLQHNVVATTSSGGTPNTAVAAFGSNNAAGSLLIAAVGTNLAAASISGIVDSRGNVWSKAVAITVSTVLDGELWYAPNSKAGANTLTITITGTTGTRATTVDLVEVSNIVLASPLDKTASQAAASGTPQTGSTAITTQAAEFLFGAVFRSATAGPSAGPTDFSTPALAWNALDEVHSQVPSVISAYAVSIATGTYDVGWTTASANYVGIMATFFAASTTAGVPKKRGLRHRPQVPVVRKKLVSRVVHDEPSPLGALVVLAPVRREKKNAGAAARATLVRGKRARHRFKGAVFNLLTFFARVPRRAKKLPAKYILHAAPVKKLARSRRPSVAAAAAMLFAAVRRPKTAGTARATSIRILRSIRRFIGNIVAPPPPLAVPPVIIHAPVLAVAPIAAPIVETCVINAPVAATAVIVARARG